MPNKVDTSPQLGLLQRYFGPSFMTKKRGGDIQLPDPPNMKKKKPIETSPLQKIFNPEAGSTLDKVKSGYQAVQKLRKK
jgi:hypothetical protein